MNTLIAVLVVVVIVYAAYWMIGLLPTPPVPLAAKTILQVIVVLAGLFALVNRLGYIG